MTSATMRRIGGVCGVLALVITGAWAVWATPATHAPDRAYAFHTATGTREEPAAGGVSRMGFFAREGRGFGISLPRVSWQGIDWQHGAAQSRNKNSARALVPGTPFSEFETRNTQIIVWHQALDADSTSAIALGQLAALYAQRAREGGPWDDYLQAERFARKSLSKRTNHNASSAITLTSVLLAQHRFTEARDVATDLVKREGDVPAYRATLGDVAMELGDYALADSLFRSVWGDRATLSIAPRIARWLELRNQVGQARKLLVAARDAALARNDIAKETQAWFHLRVGDLELRSGRPRAARAAFEAGLAIEENDPRLLSAMARLADSEKDYQGVIAWGERAMGLQLDPATLGLIGSAYAELGDKATAGEYFRTLETVVSTQPGAYHRAWSLYLLDRGLRVDEVLQKSQDELRTRKDIYGYDIVAWALEKSGRRAEAQSAMIQALRFGTPDPLLRRHAAVIGTPITSPALKVSTASTASTN